MKKLLLLGALLAWMSVDAQEQVKNYFYQPNSEIELIQVMPTTTNGYHPIGTYHIKSYVDANGLLVRKLFKGILSGNEIFYEEFYVVEANKIYLDSQYKRVNNYGVNLYFGRIELYCSFDKKQCTWEWDGVTHVITPAGKMETPYSNSGTNKYVVEKVILKQKNGYTISALRKAIYNESHDLVGVEYWCRGYGLSLELTKKGLINLFNPRLFNVDCLLSQKEVGQWALYYEAKIAYDEKMKEENRQEEQRKKIEEQRKKELAEQQKKQIEADRQAKIKQISENKRLQITERTTQYLASHILQAPEELPWLRFAYNEFKFLKQDSIMGSLTYM